MANKKSLFIQEAPNHSEISEKSTHKTLKIMIFKYCFKFLEAALMLLQIIQVIIEIFRK